MYAHARLQNENILVIWCFSHMFDNQLFICHLGPIRGDLGPARGDLGPIVGVLPKLGPISGDLGPISGVLPYLSPILG